MAANSTKALTVGESLLVGRDVAMKMSGSNQPRGKQYSLAFQAWKAKFGFVATDTGAKIPDSWLDECILCAQHRTLSDEIIASLPPAARANLGVSGLSKRVRQRLAEIEGHHRPPRVTPMAQLRDQVALTAARVDSVAPSAFGAPPETRVEMLEAALKRARSLRRQRRRDHASSAQALSLAGSRARPRRTRQDYCHERLDR